MSDDSILGIFSSLPAPPPGWFDYQYAVLSDGSLAIVRTDIDILGEYTRWWALAQKDSSATLRPDLWNRQAKIYTFDGSAEDGPVEVPLGCSPAVSRFSDGRWLLADSRSAEGHKNARLYDPMGQELAVFDLGDGIEQMLCAPDGTVWVGYFDEGVFSGPNSDGSWPVSSSGLAHFDSAGSVLWGYNNEERSSSIDDCYALTLAGNEAWLCFYSDFPIVSVSEGQVRQWRNSLGGAHALAVEDGYALLAGGYNDQAGRVALLRLGEEEAELLGEIQIPVRPRGTPGLMQGLGNTLHVVEGAVWRRISVAAVRSALGA
ncbi:hypothetical protein [Asticcacaulis sp.]|uniref:hypothetical protein n=1 Tax=Asticcacaulis sp. TaxID=1872648 RepID=UPI0031DA0B75